jgi:hypothetical protein
MPPRRHIGTRPTIRNAVENDLVISTYCNACLTAGRHLDPAELVERLGWDAVKEDIERRLRCARCGARQGTIQVSARNLPFTSSWQGSGAKPRPS